jgi:hypothetical protein
MTPAQEELRMTLLLAALSFTVSLFMWGVSGEVSAFYVFNIFTSIYLVSATFQWMVR